MVANVPVQRSATVALSLQETLWPQLEITAQNLANGTTSGFKKVYAESAETQYKTPTGDNLSYVSLQNIHHDFSPGSLKQTGNPYDLAIIGDGFFQLEGGKLTQGGQFTLTADGRIVSPTGEALMAAGGGNINIPPDSKYITISRNGAISNQNGNIATIGVYKVENKTALTYTKDGYYTTTENPVAAENVSVQQGYLMESNVNSIEETIKLLQIQRRYEQAEKLIKESYSLARDTVNVSSRSSV